MADFKIGKVTHFYDKIGVAIVALDADLGVGDRIRFDRGGEELFEQDVNSIQVEHEKIEKAGKSMVIGLKTDKDVKEGADVYKVVSD